MSNVTFQAGSTPTLTVTIKDKCGTVQPVNGATLKKIRVTIPNGTSFEVAMSYTTDGTDGKVYATFTALQLASAGTYKFQVFLTLPNGWDGPTRPDSFVVVGNLPSP